MSENRKLNYEITSLIKNKSNITIDIPNTEISSDSFQNDEKINRLYINS